MVKKENSKNLQYVFQYKNDGLSEVITYKVHLINSIKADPNARKNAAIQSFPSGSVTDQRFERFVQVAKDAGYTIYKVEKQ
mgnify:FL=1